MFPICVGMALMDAKCQTWDCCQQLNKQVWTYLSNQWQSIVVEKNYDMLFFSRGHPIECQNYSSPWTQCKQWTEYYASSDWNACDRLQDNFYAHYFDYNADKMAFTLF